MVVELVPVHVDRDENGMWLHPALIGMDEMTWKDFTALMASKGVRCEWVSMESDAPEELTERYFEMGDPDMSEWEPSPPAGDGWFILGIFDTEDGPGCLWGRSLLAVVEDVL